MRPGAPGPSVGEPELLGPEQQARGAAERRRLVERDLAEHAAGAAPGHLGGEQVRRAERGPRRGARGTAVELGGLAVGDDPAAVEQRHRVGERQRLVLVVGHEHRRRLGPGEHVGDVAAQVDAQRRVERGERLVEQHQRRADRERAGERDPLLLAAGQLVRMPVAEPGEPDQLEQPVGDGRLVPSHAERDVRSDRQVREQRGVLGHVADAAMSRVDHPPAVVDDATGDRDAARVDPLRDRRSPAAASSCRCQRHRAPP